MHCRGGAGADDYLVKPFSARELLARVDAHVELAALRRDSEVSRNAIEQAKILVAGNARLQESEQRLHNIIQSMSDAFVVLDNNWHCVLVNVQAGKLLGRHAQDLIGKHIWTEFPEAVNQRFYHLYQQAMQEQIAMELEEYYPPSDRWFESRIFPVNAGLAIFFQETTARKRADIGIHKSNTELEQRVQEHTHELAAVNRELEAFSASVSHDLRSPLRAIEGFAHALMDDYGQVLDGQGRDYLTRIRAAAARMWTLIDDLLQLARLTRDEMSRTDVDLGMLARDVIAELRQREPERSVELIIRSDIHAMGDARLLRIVLENLFDNAWKYTSKHAAARIEFGVTPHPVPQVYFIRDDGAGFDMQYAENLFGAFQRMRNFADFEGTGIGLATVARIIERHGGKIWADAKVDKGAVFYFTLASGQGDIGRYTLRGFKVPGVSLSRLKLS